MNEATDLSLTRSLETLERLLGDCGLEDSRAPSFFDEVGKGIKGYAEYVRGLVAAANEIARRFKEKTAGFLKQILVIQRARFSFAQLLNIDHHAKLTRIRRALSHQACICAPLFNYGPELSEYRHRYR